MPRRRAARPVTFSELSADQLAKLGRDVEHEIVRAAAAGEPIAGHLKLLARVESRYETLAADGAAPTVQRRMDLAADRG